MCIAAAIAGAGVAGLAGSAIAGSEAAGATTSAANTAAGEQQAALNQQETLAAPYTSLGSSAIPQLQTLLGLTPAASASSPNTSPTITGFTMGPDGMPVPTFAAPSVSAPQNTTPNYAAINSALEATPGYEFTRSQGLQGVTNGAASRGMLLSGNTLQALDQYGSGLADQTYQQAVGNLENTVGLGQAAAAGQAANIGNAAANMGNIAVNQGNTLAGIDTNTIAGLENAAGSTANNLIMQNTLANLDGSGITASDPAVQGAFNSYNASLGYSTGE